jgi:RNA polymerase sigma-70 factor (ECF subfamily)
VSECPGDDELIRLFVAGGDRAAFECLVRRYALPIRRLLYGLFCGNREDMEDAEQEVVVALFRSLPRFGFRSSFSTFYYRLARNRAIDLIRRRERERRSLRRLAAAVPPERVGHPEEIALAEVARGEAMSVLATLAAEQRAVVLLREVEGLSLEEISRVLRVPQGTVKSRLHRARRQIERRLASANTGRGR